MITYFFIFGGFMLLSWLVSFQLKSRFRKYARIPMNYSLSGCEVAEKMLRDNGIKDVRILSVKGELTDHITQPKAQDALRWAAYTYVVAAIGSLATLLYYIMIYMGRRN